MSLAEATGGQTRLKPNGYSHVLSCLFNHLVYDKVKPLCMMSRES